MPWAVDTGHPVPDTLLSLALFILTPVVFAASFIATYAALKIGSTMVCELISRLGGMASSLTRSFKGR